MDTFRTGRRGIRRALLGAAVGAGAALMCAGCAAPSDPRPAPGSASEPAPSPAEVARGVAGTVVHFTTATGTVVEVTIHEDTPTTRDFVSMLPMTLRFEDHAGVEQVASPERALDYAGSEGGMTPEAGDLFSYKPWGNLGFFTDADGLGHSTQLVRIGTTDDLDSVARLEDQDVTISIAE